MLIAIMPFFCDLEPLEIKLIPKLVKRREMTRPTLQTLPVELESSTGVGYTYGCSNRKTE